MIDSAINSVLRTITEGRFEYEIIVVTSDVPSVGRLQLKFPTIKVIEVQAGIARKRNVATRFATGEFFAFFDDDVEVLPYTIFYLFSSLLGHNVGMVYGKLLNMEFRNKLDEAGSFLTWSGFLFARCESGIEDRGQFDQEIEVMAGKSASCIVSRKVFWTVGGFDESFEILGEETDLSWRIWIAGYKVMYAPKSVAFHAFNTKWKPADFYTPARVYRNGCRNYIAMTIACPQIHNLIIPLFCQTFVWLVAGIGMFLTGKYEAGLNIYKGLADVITRLDSIIEKRKFVQNMRRVPDSAIRPFICHDPPLSYYLKRFVHYIKTGRHG